MPEEPSQIEEHISQNRQDMGRHLDELESKVQQATAFQTLIRQKPGLFVAIGVAASAVLISVVAARTRRRYR